MAEYVSLPIETDPETLADDAFAYLKTRVPGWEEAPGNLETWLIEAVSQLCADAREVAADVPSAIFRYFGSTVAGIPPVEATSASVTSTWTMRDNAGYTIPAGTLVGIPAAGDELIAFEVATDVVVSPGSTATTAGAVTLVASEPGAEANALSGTPQLLDALDYVSAITLVGTPAGGIDAEEDDDYLNRLASELQLLAPRPILARDFAVLAKRTTGVDRALALDGYNPTNQSSNNERMVSVAVVDANGLAVSAGVKAAVDADLQAKREVNFIVHVIDPTYPTIDVTFTAKAVPGWDPATVEAAAEAAVAAYLSPKDWGQPPAGDEREWYQRPVVRLFEVAEAINSVQGLDFIEALTMRTGANAFAASDITMTGAAPLPLSGVVNGTVTAGST